MSYVKTLDNATMKLLVEEEKKHSPSLKRVADVLRVGVEELTGREEG